MYFIIATVTLLFINFSLYKILKQNVLQYLRSAEYVAIYKSGIGIHNIRVCNVFTDKKL